MLSPVVRESVQSTSSWCAHLTMEFIAGPQRTFVKRKHTGPLGMQRAFYPENDVCHVYVLHPPGGVVGGDLLQIEASTSLNSAAFVTTPGATKFYRSAGQAAIFNQILNVNAGSLEWFPQENIFFDGSNVQLSTEINLASSASFMGWEIQVFGRRAGELPFTEGSVDSRLRLTVDNKPVLLDRLRVNETQTVHLKTGLRGHSVYGTQLFYPFNPIAIESARNLVTPEQGFFLSAFDDCLIVRYLGDDTECARTGFSALWRHLRKIVNSRESISPRIWST